MRKIAAIIKRVVDNACYAVLYNYGLYLRTVSTPGRLCHFSGAFYSKGSVYVQIPCQIIAAAAANVISIGDFQAAAQAVNTVAGAADNYHAVFIVNILRQNIGIKLNVSVHIHAVGNDVIVGEQGVKPVGAA